MTPAPLPLPAPAPRVPPPPRAPRATHAPPRPHPAPYAPSPYAPGATGDGGAVPLASFGPPRLLAGLEHTARLDLTAHQAVHGTAPPLRAAALLELAERAALRGRGGAAFPFARKLRAVLDAAGRRAARTAVVVNGCEGEPGCLKDTALLLYAPHLMLDGALLAAEALGAAEVRIGVTRRDVAASVRAALAERGAGAAGARVTLLPHRFVTGESSALVNGLGQAAALPSGRTVRVSESGLGGLPTLLCNAETFAQLALLARLGLAGFSGRGLPAEPGTVLLTLAGSRVLETPTGVPLAYLLELCETPYGQGVLVGGYHGAWLDPAAARTALVSRTSLAEHGGTLGAGAVLPLPGDTCPVGEVLRVAHWLAAESAGQCGPCVLGLPALVAELARATGGAGEAGDTGAAALEGVRRRARALAGRGACAHPDGTARFLTSALAVFAADFAGHAAGRPCGREVRGILPLPSRYPEPPRPGAPPAGPRLVVDWTLCQGHGLCAGIVPELVRLDPDGYPAGSTARIPAHLHRHARRAVRRCPALALRVEE